VISIPAGPDEITSQWLRTVLGSVDVGLDCEAKSCSVERIGQGIGFICRIYRVTLTYGHSSPDVPQSVVVKLNSDDPQFDRYWAQPGRSAYEKEARFYREIAATADLRTPCYYYDATDWDARRSVLVMEDLSWTRAGNQVDGYSADDAIVAARDWARFNAGFWNNDRLRSIGDLPGFTSGIESLQRRFDDAWPACAHQFGDTLPASVSAIGSALMKTGAIAVRHKLGESPHTLCHGDLHLDNMFFIDEPDARGIAVIDWNGLRAGPGVWDLAHTMCQGLEPEERRACEHDVLSAYCDTLVACGIDDYNVDRAWRDYRLSALTHLQKLVRGLTMKTNADRHLRLREAIRRRTISAVVDNCNVEMITG
jgi:hypothetical protein